MRFLFHSPSAWRQPENAKLPPLWLSAAAAAAALTAADGLMRRVEHFLAEPYDNDFRLTYVAAKIGLQYGWSHMYDRSLEQRVMAEVTPYANGIDAMHNYVVPPLFAVLNVPFLLLSVPAGFVVWVVFLTGLLLVAWWLVAPGGGFARITLLLIAFALWPMYYALLIGQTTSLSIAGLAVVWRLLEKQRWASAGVVLAAALSIKPQLVLLLPAALLVSGRWRPVLYCGLATGALAAASIALIGPHGLVAYQNTLVSVSRNPFNGILTYEWFGRGTVATSLEVSLGLLALGLAWYRRHRLDIVFALGIAGSTASAIYLHEYDVAVFVLPTWILLRSHASLPMRGWLVLGIACAQLIAIGVIQPILVWEAGWIGLLGWEPWLVKQLARASIPGRLETQPIESV